MKNFFSPSSACSVARTKEGLALKSSTFLWCLSTDTVLDCFRHALFALHKTLDAMVPRLICWPDAAELETMTGMITGFPDCFYLVDRNKNGRWRPEDNHEQERAYDGYKHAHLWAIMVFCDVFGRFIRLEMTAKGAEIDRTLYTESNVYGDPDQNLSAGQHGMADMDFGKDGELAFQDERKPVLDAPNRVQFDHSQTANGV